MNLQNNLHKTSYQIKHAYEQYSTIWIRSIVTLGLSSLSNNMEDDRNYWPFASTWVHPCFFGVVNLFGFLCCVFYLFAFIRNLFTNVAYLSTLSIPDCTLGFLNVHFHFKMALNLNGGRKWRKPQTCHKSLTIFITYSCVQYIWL